MRIALRALVILFGAAIATVTAGLMAAIASAAMHATFSDFTSMSFDIVWYPFITSLYLWTYLIVLIVFVPYLVAAILAEAAGIRSLIPYLITAVAITCVSPVFAGKFIPWLGSVPITRDTVVPVISAGLAAGFVYWLVAGRKAGNWKAN
jgi:hypothetical protein